jgi:hypothetical protein
MMSKRLVLALLGLTFAFLAMALFRTGSSEVLVASTPEERIVAYLDENVAPGQFVLVTDLYNNVFTSPEEREALERLYDSVIEIPAFAAQTYRETARIPSLGDISEHFGLEVPGTANVLLRVLESDPRIPRFLERDPTTGEILRIDVDAIVAHERFGRSLRN